MFLDPQNDTESEGPYDRWLEWWFTNSVVEEPHSSFDLHRISELYPKGQGKVNHPAPLWNQRDRWQTALRKPSTKEGVSLKIRRKMRNGLVTVVTKLPSHHIPGRIRKCSAKIWVKLLSLAYVAYVETCKVTRVLWWNHSSIPILHKLILRKRLLSLFHQ